MFLTFLVTKANAVEEETRWAALLRYQRKQSIHVTDGITVTLLSASLLHKISAATDRQRQIALNRKLLCEFDECRKVSSLVEAKSKKSVKRDLPISNTCFFSLQKAYENSPKYYFIRTLQFFQITSA
jgi:hypothetical protein